MAWNFPSAASTSFCTSLVFAHIGTHRQAVSADFRRRGLQLLAVSTGNHHLCAFTNKNMRNGFANATAAAGDDRNFAC